MLEVRGLSLYHGSHRNQVGQQCAVAWIARLNGAGQLTHEPFELPFSYVNLINFSQTQLYKDLTSDFSHELNNAGHQGDSDCTAESRGQPPSAPSTPLPPQPGLSKVYSWLKKQTLEPLAFSHRFSKITFQCTMKWPTVLILSHLK